MYNGNFSSQDQKLASWVCFPFLSAIIFYKVFLVRDLFLGDSGPPHPSKNTESDVSVQGVLEVNDVGVPR